MEVWSGEKNFPVYGTTHFYITTTHHHPPTTTTKKICFKRFKRRGWYKCFDWDRLQWVCNDPIRSQLNWQGRYDHSLYPGVKNKTTWVILMAWLDQTNETEAHPIRMVQTNQLETSRIRGPAGDGYVSRSLAIKKKQTLVCGRWNEGVDV